MKNLPAVWDGASGPVLRFLLKDGGTVKDTSSVAVELKIRDADSGTTLATRPGVLVSPKANGYVDVWLKGSEVDWAGAGRNIIIVPKLYFATTAAGAAATNLLANPSFDTYNSTLGIASCTTTNTLRKVTSSAAFGNIYAGMTVTGTGIPGGTYVDAVLDSSTIYLTAAATGSATVTLTFGRLGSADSWPIGGTTVVASCTTNGTTALTSSGAFGSVEVGQRIYGQDIVEGTTVLSKTDSSNITLSAAATGSSTVNRAFTRTGYGFGGLTYSVGADDPAPSTIFGSRQSVYIASASQNTVYQWQSVTGLTINAGDTYSVGFWHRAKLDAGAALQGEPGYYYSLNLTGGTSESQKTYIAAGDTDWHFLTAQKQATDSHTGANLTLICYDAIGYQVRFDDAFLFAGKWRTIHADPLRLPVRSRVVVSKALTGSTYTQIGGRGGFEYDSNADGVADGWVKTGSTNTYAHEVDPDNLHTDSIGAQKVTLAGSTTDRLRLICRGKFEAGQLWAFRVWYKNGGALTGSPASGDFAVVLSSEEFDGAVESGTTNIGTSNQASYAIKQASMTLASNHNALVCDIYLRNVTGTAWFDSATLWRVS